MSDREEAEPKGSENGRAPFPWKRLVLLLVVLFGGLVVFRAFELHRFVNCGTLAEHRQFLLDYVAMQQLLATLIFMAVYAAATAFSLPVGALLRRRDGVEVIGAALAAKSAGAGHRRIAAGLGVPATTVRGWLRRFAARAGFLYGQFMALAHLLDRDLGRVEPRGSPVADAVEAIGVAASAAARRFGPAPVWWFASGASAGRLLANTNSPFPLVG